MKKDDKNKQIVNFLFEVGTMRKLPRIHQQVLLSQDLSDNIATHSYRVSLIAWFLAKLEKADPYKTMMMGFLHDVKEVRSGDHNYIHKKYVKIFEKEISKDQLGELPFSDLLEIDQEFEERKSKEAIIAKDADLLDQILLLKEYTHQGNKEAEEWLSGKGNDKVNIQYKSLKTEAAKKLGKEILEGKVSEWWENIWTPKNR
ncbi:MAG: HD domain-containing protein [Candidatus Nomurabacteria bacterium]|nr:HD domain-containing protein [Candidatus Nomurabacteria bacterium]